MSIREALPRLLLLGGMVVLILLVGHVSYLHGGF